MYDGKPDEAVGNNNVAVPSLLNGVAAARVGVGAAGVVVVAFMLICWMARARS